MIIFAAPVVTAGTVSPIQLLMPAFTSHVTSVIVAESNNEENRFTIGNVLTSVLRQMGIVVTIAQCPFGCFFGFPNLHSTSLVLCLHQDGFFPGIV